jgi:hypothetical protein
MCVLVASKENKVLRRTPCFHHEVRAFSVQTHGLTAEDPAIVTVVAAFFISILMGGALT